MIARLQQSHAMSAFTRTPRWNDPGADSEEKHEPVGDIDTAAMESLKALDPNRPIRGGPQEGHTKEKPRDIARGSCSPRVNDILN